MFEESVQDEDEHGRDENYGTVADRNEGEDEVFQPSFSYVHRRQWGSGRSGDVPRLPKEPPCSWGVSGECQGISQPRSQVLGKCGEGTFIGSCELTGQHRERA